MPGHPDPEGEKVADRGGVETGLEAAGGLAFADPCGAGNVGQGYGQMVAAVDEGQHLLGADLQQVLMLRGR